jgi:hypothetical protein
MTSVGSTSSRPDTAMPDEFRRWLHQTSMTDPRHEVAMLDGLPDGIARLCRIVQGALIHLEWIGAYGLSESDVARPSRETLSLSERLRQLTHADPRPLVIPRAARARVPGTCRDFALMLCGLLRHQHIPARVRCGFAAYFREAHWEDHWICEVWLEAERRWRRVDAQLDGVLGRRLGIAFDPTDLPSDAFMSAGDAWLRCRAGRDDPQTFGHGSACGMWFVRVNVMRDHLVLNGTEVSVWDTWRNATVVHRMLPDDDVQVVDSIAADPTLAMRMIAPPWIA